MEHVHTFNGVHVSCGPSGNRTLGGLIVERVAECPDAPFLTVLDATLGYETVTFAEFDDLSLRAATWLSAELELGLGDTLAVAPRNDLPSVVTIFGALRLGLAVALLDPDDPSRRRSAIAESVGATRTLEVMPPLGVLPSSRFEGLGPEPTADALYFPTSGSTAVSKVVAQTHRGAVANALGVRAHHALGPHRRFLGCLPIHHVNGFHFTVVAALASGMHVMLVREFDPFLYPRLLDSFRPSLASVVPSLLRALLATWRPEPSPAGFSYFVSAAAPLERALAQDVWERWKVRVIQGYGLTETTNFSTTLPADLSGGCYRRHVLDADIPSIGSSIPGNEVAVLDEHGDPLPQGAEGEICVRGHNVMSRYVGNRQATREAFRGGWFHTGDRGYSVEALGCGGNVFVITGRDKNVVKVRGESVSLEEIERVLIDLPGIRDAVCIGFPDPKAGERITAVVVVEGHVSDDLIRAHLSATLRTSALPSRIERYSSIPRTATGKVKRPQLVESLLRRKA